MKRTLILLLSLAGLLNAHAQMSNSDIVKVENGLITYVPVKGFPAWNIYQRMKYYNVKGVSVAVIKDFKIDWAKGYGLADTAKNIPVTTATMFSAGSVSKFVAAVMALKLVDEGKLQLDSPINKYLKSWKLGGNDFTKKTPVTLRMLLSHTAGTSQSSYFGFTPDHKVFPTIVEILSGAPIAESRAVVVNSEPGKEFRYSGGGSIIAQLAMMDVTGSDFAQLARSSLFDAIGMSNSTYEQPLPQRFNSYASWGYSAAPWYKGTPYVYPQQAAAGLYSTPTDLARFVIEIQNCYRGKGNILKQPTARQMMTPMAQVSKGTYNERIGVGPFLLELTTNTEDKGGYFEFTGVNAGFTAYVIGNLTEGYGAVIMLNTGDDNNGFGMELRRAIAKTYNWYHFLPDEVKPIKLSETEANQYVGRYRKGPNEVVNITREKNYFIERINNGPVIYCFPVAQDTLVLTDFGVNGFLKRGDDGQVTGFQTVYQDTPMPKMAADEFTADELMAMKRYEQAIDAYAKLHLNEYQLTYVIYGLLNSPGADRKAIVALLQLAKKTFPASSIVFNRWGDYYLKTGDKQQALSSYQSALKLQPDDTDLQKKIEELAKTKN